MYLEQAIRIRREAYGTFYQFGIFWYLLQPVKDKVQAWKIHITDYAWLLDEEKGIFISAEEAAKHICLDSGETYDLEIYPEDVRERILNRIVVVEKP